jgi:tetratricopeptide (TPR) repeat protein
VIRCRRRYLKRVLICLIYIVAANIILYSEDIAEYSAKWKEFESEGKFAEAAAYFKKAIVQNPDEAWLYVFVGYSELKLEMNVSAIEHFEKAHSLRPSDEAIKSSTGYGYFTFANELALHKGRWSDSLSYYSKAQAIQPSNAHYAVKYGYALSQSGRHEEARKIFSVACKLGAGEDPNNLPYIKEGILLGMDYFNVHDDPNNLLQFKELAQAFLADDRTATSLLFLSYVETGSLRKAEAVVQTMKNSAEKEAFEAACVFFRGDEKEADPLFKIVSGRIDSDYLIDELISSFYKFRITKLPCDSRKTLMFHDKELEYSSIAVKKYFRIHPFKQPLPIIPPLRSEFTVYQGEGGKESHYGLRAHYSWDLGIYDGDAAGTPVIAVCDGKASLRITGEVASEENEPVTLLIDHGSFMSVYENLARSSIRVKDGDPVRTGQIVGEICELGGDGKSHLHFSAQNKDGITLPVRFTRLVSRMPSEKKWSQASELSEGYIYKTK